jgi:hypothetical protein
MESHDLKEIKEKLEEILELLNGNGKLGICGKVQIIWSVGLWLVIAVVGQALALLKLILLP